jgi:hypothetical protein
MQKVEGFASIAEMGEFESGRIGSLAVEFGFKERAFFLRERSNGLNERFD